MSNNIKIILALFGVSKSASGECSMIFRLSSFIVPTLLLAACSQNDPTTIKTPSEVYQTYYQHVVSGISFDEDVNYQSQSQRRYVAQKLEAMEAQGNQSSKELIKLYLTVTQKAAQCGTLTLTDETIEDEIAYLTYDRKDVCNDGKVTTAGQKITMVFEAGWKIDDDVTSMGGE